MHRRAAMVLAFAGALAAGVILEAPLCPLAGLAHIPCPGCGLTRATISLLRGDFEGALALHPLAPVVAPLVSGLLALHALSYWRSGRLFELRGRASRFGNVALLGFALAMLAVWVARFLGAFGGPVAV